MAEFEIRSLVAGDRSGWEPLWRGYLSFYRAELPEDVTEHSWQRLIESHQDPYGLVAVDQDKKLRGMVHYLYHSSTWTKGPYCYLQDLFVDPDFRGRGAGEALIEAVCAQARVDGADQVYWLTQELNHSARTLYDRVGTLTPFIKYRGF